MTGMWTLIFEARRRFVFHGRENLAFPYTTPDPLSASTLYQIDAVPHIYVAGLLAADTCTGAFPPFTGRHDRSD